jgi:hypothetical protein
MEMILNNFWLDFLCKYFRGQFMVLIGKRGENWMVSILTNFYETRCDHKVISTNHKTDNIFTQQTKNS